MSEHEENHNSDTETDNISTTSSNHENENHTMMSTNTNTTTTNTNSSTNTVIIEPGLQIEQVISNNNSSSVINTTFISTEPDKYDPNITQNLSQVVSINENISETNNALMNQIKDYASKINCSDFHGKGTIEDYSELFKAASKIANESKQIQLDVDVDGFNEFSQAAEDLSNLFESFTIRLLNNIYIL